MFLFKGLLTTVFASITPVTGVVGNLLGGLLGPLLESLLRITVDPKSFVTQVLTEPSDGPYDAQYLLKAIPGKHIVPMRLFFILNEKENIPINWKELKATLLRSRTNAEFFGQMPDLSNNYPVGLCIDPNSQSFNPSTIINDLEPYVEEDGTLDSRTLVAHLTGNCNLSLRTVLEKQAKKIQVSPKASSECVKGKNLKNVAEVKDLLDCIRDSKNNSLLKPVQQSVSGFSENGNSHSNVDGVFDKLPIGGLVGGGSKSGSRGVLGGLLGGKKSGAKRGGGFLGLLR